MAALLSVLVGVLVVVDELLELESLLVSVVVDEEDELDELLPVLLLDLLLP